MGLYLNQINSFYLNLSLYFLKKVENTPKISEKKLKKRIYKKISINNNIFKLIYN